ncbi:sulfate adenylyltransferase subunit 1 [Hydrobacter penzbergensis]|uniref:sulfate adenylyltransferase n=1 Tax=Hydrobacter penzbergensis TaxID=1235997 RepID=A0A8X8IHT1_9BACT|nr:GTP-binding protein [Hydrobacter penzbergensis]MBN8719717.1 GTP-binding protein [Sediminibacterium magnilacihabitans]PQV60117.1 sulfate adenylyltransferase subunit 1 [Sediminibacterium magnilacihabitans]SDX36020.1 sulfate adenylyltransferase subunit 1 [Hydrobacter penzbergensis]
MDLLRFITAGSVDDGKSTLIGRLLYDSKSIMIDQLEAIEKQSKNKADGEIDLALLTDGLRAEREQGITIDVAYKYFATPKRKFIIADAPGHIQYTRNMVTGASNADLAIILIDARNGVVEQTRRHSIIASLLNIPHVVVAVNKMDLVNNSQDVYNNIVIDYAEVAKTLGLNDVTYIPISAINGANIVEKSEDFPWYEGASLLHILENVQVENDINHTDARFPVQFVIRPQTDALHDYRGYAGKISSGVYAKGDKVTVLPSGTTSAIKAIEVGGKEVKEAYAPQSVVLHLEDDIDISRGDIIVKTDNQPAVGNEIEVLLCWMDHKPLIPGNKYLLQLNSKTVRSVVKEITYKLDVNSLQQEAFPEKVGLNDVVKATIKTASPIAYDSYKKLRTNGGAILIDETSHVTVGACMIQ